MTTPPPPEIVIGDIWYLLQDLGVGLGSIPAGEQVTIEDLLDPYSPGVGQTEEITVVCVYTYYEDGFDDWGQPVQFERQRRLAYPESVFRAMFAPVETEVP